MNVTGRIYDPDGLVLRELRLFGGLAWAIALEALYTDFLAEDPANARCRRGAFLFVVLRGLDGLKADA